jgi:uncharacterized membrane protein YdjX (TVP38/TMEM64 family)
MRLLAPATFADGAWFWPYTGVLNSGVAATTAAAVAVFLRKSRRGSAADEEVA